MSFFTRFLWILYVCFAGTTTALVSFQLALSGSQAFNYALCGALFFSLLVLAWLFCQWLVLAKRPASLAKQSLQAHWFQSFLLSLCFTVGIGLGGLGMLTWQNHAIDEMLGSFPSSATQTPTMARDTPLPRVIYSNQNLLPIQSSATSHPSIPRSVLSNFQPNHRLQFFPQANLAFVATSPNTYDVYTFPKGHADLLPLLIQAQSIRTMNQSLLLALVCFWILLFAALVYPVRPRIDAFEAEATSLTQLLETLANPRLIQQIASAPQLAFLQPLEEPLNHLIREYKGLHGRQGHISRIQAWHQVMTQVVPPLQAQLQTMQAQPDTQASATEMLRLLNRWIQPIAIPATNPSVQPINQELVTICHNFQQKYKNCQITTQIPRDSVLCYVDMPVFARVLRELFRNAMDAWHGQRRREPLQIQVALLYTHAHVEITVTDNAGGLPETLVSHALNPYASNKPRHMGNGLAIAESIMLQMYGTLWYETFQEQTCFHLDLAKTPGDPTDKHYD